MSTMAKAKKDAAAVVDMTGAGPTGAEGAEDAAAIAGDAAVAVAAADAVNPPEVAAPVDEAAEAKARLAAISAELAAIGDPDAQVKQYATERGTALADIDRVLTEERKFVAELDQKLRLASDQANADREVIRVRIREAAKLAKAFGLPFVHGQTPEVIASLGLANLGLEKLGKAAEKAG
jgi:hypothetical protein